MSFLFFFFFMPEMKGRSLEELDEIFAARVPTWKFKEYQCIVKDEAAHDMAERTGIKLKEDTTILEELEHVPHDRV